MRKRIAIGLLILIVGGVVAFLFSGPKEGSVEYHKKEYLTAWKRLHHQTVADKTKQFLSRIAGSGEPAGMWTDDESANKRMLSHQAALLKLGYLGQQTFILTNCSRPQVLKSPGFASAWGRSHREFVDITIQNSNTLAFITVTEDLPMFIEAVRKVDKR